MSAAEQADVRLRLRAVIARLELCSHVSAASPGSSTGDASESIGGKRPPGGIEKRDERRDGVYGDEEMVFLLKGAEYFRRRMGSARTVHALEEILADAERSLRAFTHQPAHDPKSEPGKDSPLWKHWCATTSMSVAEIAWKYNVSRQYVKRVIEAYGRDAA